MLQSVDINFSSAVNLINTVGLRADVTELRSQDENFNNLYMDAVQLCEMSGIEANFVAVSSARKKNFLQNLWAAVFLKLSVTDQM